MGKAHARIVSFCYLRLPYPPPSRFDIELRSSRAHRLYPGRCVQLKETSNLYNFPFRFTNHSTPFSNLFEHWNSGLTKFSKRIFHF